MSSIFLATIIVSTIGIVLGVGLAIASIVMAVPIDEKAEAINEVLPGANCGACGFSGCAGYADALSKGKTTDTALCAPGGNDVVEQIATVLGVAAGNIVPKSAVVMCHGTKANCDTILNYVGVQTCKSAAQLFEGPKACNYGCLGFGDCAHACPYDAINLCDGIAVVNPLACRACKVCINTCPKNLIELVPLYETKAAVFCKNKNRGALTRKECKVGCIGCTKCVKACEFDAITIENNVAHVDPEKCTGCGICIEGCPTKCLSLITLGGKNIAVNQ